MPQIGSLKRGFHLLAMATAFSAAAALSPPARAADTPFIDQIPNGQMVNLPSNAGPPLKPHLPLLNPPSSELVPSITPSPHFAAPHSAHANTATTVEIGNYNSVFQLQAGIDDRSTVGILGGNGNNVGVIQAGNNLVSDLLLIGTQGMNVGVLQRNNSAPVRMAIIHVPAGTVIIPH
jgi:hypothetical protein